MIKGHRCFKKQAPRGSLTDEQKAEVVDLYYNQRCPDCGGRYTQEELATHFDVSVFYIHNIVSARNRSKA